jgi:hypothetical protein
LSLLVLLLLLLGGFALSAQVVDGDTPIYISVHGKTTVAILEKNPYTVFAVGGPAEGVGGNYSFVVTVEGADVADAVISPSNGKSSTGEFKFNLTAPSASTQMTIVVKVTSESDTGSELTASLNYYINSVVPIVIAAKVVNEGSMALLNVPVYFYGDGRLLDQQNISLTAGASKIVYYNWTESVRQGQHEVQVVLDPNGEFVRFESGGTDYTQTIYVGMNNYDNTDAILIGGIVILLFIGYLVYKRPGQKRRKK